MIYESSVRIVLIASLFNIATADIKSLNQITKIPQLVSNPKEYVYVCKFAKKVDCLWTKNGRKTNISPYVYVTGNGLDTNDCSIKGPRNIYKPNHTCIGLESQTKYAELGDSIQLECFLKKNMKCGWQRNKTVVEIKGRYEFHPISNRKDVTDCSVKISSLKPIDMVKWECENLVDDDHVDVEMFILHQIKDISKMLITDPIDDGNDDLATQQTVDDAKNSIENSNGLSLGLTLLIATTNVVLAGVVIGLVIFVCKHYNQQKSDKIKTNTDQKEPEQHDEINIVYASPTSVYYDTDNVEVRLQNIPPNENDGYLVPVTRPSLTPSVNSAKLVKCKTTSPISASSDFEHHIYEKVAFDYAK